MAQEEDKPEPRFANKDAIPLVNWWSSAELCEKLGISEDLRKEFEVKLNNMQITYQIAQGNLKASRDKQSKMFYDGSVSEAELAAFHAEHVAGNSDEMQRVNFQARTMVRKMLSKEQLAKIEATRPNFFGARWFRFSSVRVQEGKVILKKKK